MSEEYKSGDYVVKIVDKKALHGTVLDDCKHYRTQHYGQIEPVDGSIIVLDKSNLSVLIDSLLREDKRKKSY